MTNCLISPIVSDTRYTNCFAIFRRGQKKKQKPKIESNICTGKNKSFSRRKQNAHAFFHRRNTRLVLQNKRYFLCVSQASAKREVDEHYESRATGAVRRKEYTCICIPLSCSIVLTMLWQPVQGGNNLQSCGKNLFHVI